MAVPTFERFWAPTLQALSDGEARTIDDVVDLVAWHFNLSDEDRSAMTRGGTNTQVRDRINWSTTYLAKAGLLHRPFRNRVQITDRGSQVLRDLDRGSPLDLAYLRRFPEFVEFQERRGTRRPADDRHAGTIAETSPDWNTRTVAGEAAGDRGGDPRCRLHHALQQFLGGLDASELLAVVDSFLVVEGYHRLDGESAGEGYGDANQATTVLGLDAFGVARVLVQTIRSDALVQSAAIHRFVREMSGRRCRFGVLVARHGFAHDAREALALLEKDVVLIDGHDLARRLADRALGGAAPFGSGRDA